ncbi:hypothetical protein [Streptomyces sp. 6N223]|uniref:hypothetical protein n=1 Tax=Streptomyces sp. 6N223 TaxID=3457412 RepID=UPI003FD5A7B1
MVNDDDGVARRLAKGARGLVTRWAWRRLVRACAAGDPAVQDAIRAAAAGLSEEEVLDLLAVGPAEPADRAAYLTLIGQQAQRRALDPDGSLLALAYRAATPEVRERLRVVLGADGDADVIRVVVTGEERDRIAAMSHGEIDYLAHHLAEHHRWDELGRLARDLPLAQAAAVARLLPPQPERPALAGHSASDLRATVDRLPREPLLRSEPVSASRVALAASFAPDAAELALMVKDFPRTQFGRARFGVDTLRIGTGEVSDAGEVVIEQGSMDTVLHLGDEILVSLVSHGKYLVVRIVPDRTVLRPPFELSALGRSSGGAVAVGPQGLTFADPGATTLRYQPIRGPLAPGGKGARFRHDIDHRCLATLPEARRVAFFDGHGIWVVSEDGEVVHQAEAGPRGPHGDRRIASPGNRRIGPVLTFLSPDSLALHYNYEDGFSYRPHTEIWEFPAKGAARRTAHHDGPIRELWPFETWFGLPLQDEFATRIGNPVPDGPWLHLPEGHAPRLLLAISPEKDMIATHVHTGHGWAVEVHSPHLAAARELLERPLLHSRPGDLSRARELRPKIGDPAVRDALGLLTARLADRFGDAISLGDGATPAAGPDDIALGRGGER